MRDEKGMEHRGKGAGTEISKEIPGADASKHPARSGPSPLFPLPSSLLSLLFAFLAYLGAFEAFSHSAWPDISSKLLSLAALLGGVWLFGVAAKSLRPGQDGWCIVLSTGKRLPVRGLLVLGRSASADLKDPSLLERHARLFLRGQELFLEDVARRGDVYINGAAQEGEPARLSPGDAVTISALRFQVRR